MHKKRLTAETAVEKSLKELLKHRKVVRKFLEDKKCVCYNGKENFVIF